MILIAITNPSDASAEAGTVQSISGICTPKFILEELGEKLEDGDQVVMVEDDRVWQYLVTRSSNEAPIALRPNNALGVDARYGDGESCIDHEQWRQGEIIECGTQKLVSEGELETFTVFGNNDDGEDFVAVVSATEDTVYDAGVQAGLIDGGYEQWVTIDLIVKGDESDLERVSH